MNTSDTSINIREIPIFAKTSSPQPLLPFHLQKVQGPQENWIRCPYLKCVILIMYSSHICVHEQHLNVVVFSFFLSFFIYFFLSLSLSLTHTHTYTHTHTHSFISAAPTRAPCRLTSFAFMCAPDTPAGLWVHHHLRPRQKGLRRRRIRRDRRDWRSRPCPVRHPCLPCS